MADGEWLREVEYVQHVADTALPQQPQIGAIVGSAPIADGAANTTYWVKRMLAASPLFRGIRRGLPSPPANTTACDYLLGAFLDGVRVLGDHGLHFELLLQSDPVGLSCAPAMVKAANNTQFVVNHMGDPDIHDGQMARWAAAMAELAKLPNVVMKFSGMPQEDGDAWNVKDFEPYFAEVWRLFGPGRMAFGGNWFVVNVHANYHDWAGAAMELLKKYATSQQQIDAVLGGTAMRVYRIKSD